jgi:hypothetical protein
MGPCSQIDRGLHGGNAKAGVVILTNGDSSRFTTAATLGLVDQVSR